MVQPDTGPANLPVVKAYLAMAAEDTRNDTALDLVIEAVNAWVRTLPIVNPPRFDDPIEWPAYVRLGAVMLAARLFRRRDTPAGVAAFGDQGAVYVQRNDPDVALLLQLGPYSKPAVG